MNLYELMNLDPMKIEENLHHLHGLTFFSGWLSWKNLATASPSPGRFTKQRLVALHTANYSYLRWLSKNGTGLSSKSSNVNLLKRGGCKETYTIATNKMGIGRGDKRSMDATNPGKIQHMEKILHPAVTCRHPSQGDQAFSLMSRAISWLTKDAKSIQKSLPISQDVSRQCAVI
jgi:hypothetical protein